jgi:hypothetical protein
VWTSYAAPKPPSVPASSGGLAHPQTAPATTAPTAVVQKKRTTTTAATVATMGAVAAPGMATPRIRVPTHLGPPSTTPGSALFRCGQVPGSRAAGAALTSGHDGGHDLLRLSALAGRACLYATPGATACPPWAHAAAGPAFTQIGVEPVD